jgi:ABC-type multidrug transport system fused ATPase/permease subunit
MFNIKETLGLSDGGYRDFKRAVGAVALTNLSRLLPFIVIIQTIITLLNPLLGGGAPGGAGLDRNRLWLLWGLGLAAAALYFLAYRNEYRKTYTVAYSESEKIRLEVAEHIRRLPLSFFNHKDLSELTTNMMTDCTSIEHTMSHVASGLFANLITIVFTCALLALYDWRMSAALFVALPAALGLILGSAKIYSPLIVVFTLLPEFFYMLVSTKRMRDLRREPVMAGDEQFVPANYNIELKNVSFGYTAGGQMAAHTKISSRARPEGTHNEDEVIKNISLSIPQGGAYRRWRGLREAARVPCPGLSPGSGTCGRGRYSWGAGISGRSIPKP